MRCWYPAFVTIFPNIHVDLGGFVVETLPELIARLNSGLMLEKKLACLFSNR